jgi:hypothetical protein
LDLRLIRQPRPIGIVKFGSGSPSVRVGAVGVVHDWLMTSRPVFTIAIAAVAAIALAACGGDSEDGDTTLPEITLLTTTSEAPLFEESDGQVASASTLAASDEATTTIVETAASTTLVADAVTTSVATPVSADTTTTAAPAPAAGGFVLGPDGLGAVPFGAEPEQTITFVTNAFGAPTLDTGWVDPFDIGPCGGTRIRQVSWNQLQLEFGDVSDVSEGRDHFYAYFYGVEGSSTPQPAGLQTAEKIGAGSSVAELLSAYPGAKLLMGDEFIGPSFFVNDNLAGRMSGVTDADVVEAVIGGRPCDG